MSHRAANINQTADGLTSKDELSEKRSPHPTSPTQTVTTATARANFRPTAESWSEGFGVGEAGPSDTTEKENDIQNWAILKPTE